MEQTRAPLQKWQMRDLYILTSFFIIGFLILPNSFFSRDDNFNSLLAGISFGIGLALLIRFFKQQKKGVDGNE